MVGLIKKIFRVLRNNKWWAIYSVTVILFTILFKYYQIVINCTHSLPQKLFIAEVGDKQLKLNDFVIAYSRGLPNLADNVQLVKIVVGLPNEVVSFKNNKLFINDRFCCNVNDHKVVWGEVHPLTLKQLKIPAGCYFVKGASTNSFDSRYKEFGLICKDQILGRAISLF